MSPQPDRGAHGYLKLFGCMLWTLDRRFKAHTHSVWRQSSRVIVCFNLYSWPWALGRDHTAEVADMRLFRIVAAGWSAAAHLVLTHMFSLASVPGVVISQPQPWCKCSVKPSCSTVLSSTAWLFFYQRRRVFIVREFYRALTFPSCRRRRHVLWEAIPREELWVRRL